MIQIAKPLIGEDEKNAVLAVLDSGMIVQGPQVEKLETEFASLIGVKHAIATSNGTTALHLALLAAGIGPGDEVITVPFSFIATASTIRHVGAIPVFVDINNDFLIDTTKIEAAITSKTKAIMPVHLYGNVCDMKEIQRIASKHNLIIVEDACQAHGATSDGKYAGSFGIGCFSLYGTKNMTSAEGGIITTNDPEVARKLYSLRNHGSEKRYHHDTIGYNFRLTDIHASIGLVQLKRLNESTVKRRFNAALYSSLIQRDGIITPRNSKGHVYHQYTIRVTKDFPMTRDELKQLLFEKGIGSEVFYPIPFHKQECFKEYQYESHPVSEKMSEEVLSLPVHPLVLESDIKYISEVIQSI